MSTIQTSLFPTPLAHTKQVVQVQLGIEPFIPKALYSFLRDSGIFTTADVRRMMLSDQFKISQEPKTVETVAIHTSDLGFDNQGGPIFKIYERAIQEGCKLCSSEVGPRRRLDCRKSLLKNELIIGSEPMEFRGRLYLFRLTTVGGQPALCATETTINNYISGYFVFEKA